VCRSTATPAWGKESDLRGADPECRRVFAPNGKELPAVLALLCGPRFASAVRTYSSVQLAKTRLNQGHKRIHQVLGILALGTQVQLGLDGRTQSH